MLLKQEFHVLNFWVEFYNNFNLLQHYNFHSKSGGKIEVEMQITYLRITETLLKSTEKKKKPMVIIKDKSFPSYSSTVDSLIPETRLFKNY